VLGNHDQRLLDVIDGRRPMDAAGARCAAALDRVDEAWRPFLRALPLFAEVAGWTIVHAALHPSGDLERTTHRMATVTRRWPSERSENPHWTSAYEGARRVLYGHDAVRGRYESWRGGRRWLVGLDGGCVYGGVLCGYVVEEDRILCIPAARQYKDMRPEGDPATLPA
jgi:hypothetical protein